MNNKDDYKTVKKHPLFSGVFITLLLILVSSFMLNIYQYSIFLEKEDVLTDKDQFIRDYEMELNAVHQILKIDSLLFLNELNMAENDLQELEKYDFAPYYENVLESRKVFLHTLFSENKRLNKNLDSLKSQLWQQKNLKKDYGDSLQLESTRYSEKLVDFRDSLHGAKTEIARLQQHLEKKDRVKVLQFESMSGQNIYYLGEVQDGKANGAGVGIWPTGSIYRGFWKNNRRHGEGTIESHNGEKYEGQWTEGKREGEGVYYWPTGERYDGEWKNNRRNGHGTLYDPDGNVKIKGMWKNDKPM